MDILKLKQRYDALKADRSAEEAVWDEIERYIMPLTGQTPQATQATQGSSTQSKTDVGLWDLTAPLSCEHLANALQSDATSPTARWLDFEFEDPEVEQDLEAVKYREKLAEMVWGELQASDFNMEIGSAYLEYAGLGNMCLVEEPTSKNLGEWKGLDFTAVPIRQVQFEEDSRGGVLRWYRLLQWTPGQIIDHCEKDEQPVPQRIRDMAADPSSATKKIPVLFCIFRREGAPEEVEEEVIAKLRPFGSVYFTADQCEQLGEEGGYYRMPVVMVRWAKRPGTQWGFGRGHIALRHVKGLNASKELQQTQGEKAVDPAWGMTERVGGPIDMRPGKTNVVPSKDDLWPLEGSVRFDVSAELIRDDRLEIRRAFHEDDLQLKESPQMTATEVQARKDQMNRAIGSPVGRLNTDGLQPISLLTLDHLGRAKRLPAIPAIVKEKKAQVRLRFRGPIARAQLMDEVVAIERSAAFIATLVKLGFPAARHRLNLDGMIKEHSKRLGSPAAMFNSAAEAKRREAEENRAMAAAQAAETMKAAGQGMAAAASAGIPIGEQPALVPSGGVVA